MGYPAYQQQQFAPPPGPPPGHMHMQVPAEYPTSGHKFPGHASAPAAPPPMPQQQGPVRFKIVKPSFKNRYECRAGNSSDGQSIYSLKICDKKHRPSLTLMAGSGSGTPVAESYYPKLSRYYNSDPKTFRLSLGTASSEMQYAGKDKYGWTFYSQGVPFVWHKSNHHAVDGMSASRLSDNNFVLQDPSGQVVAVFTSATMSFSMSAIGSLQINVNMGPAFEHLVVMTVMTIYDHQKRESDKRSSNNAGGGAAASSG